MRYRRSHMKCSFRRVRRNVQRSLSLLRRAAPKRGNHGPIVLIAETQKRTRVTCWEGRVRRLQSWVLDLQLLHRRLLDVQGSCDYALSTLFMCEMRSTTRLL